MIKENIYSHLTAIPRTSLSFPAKLMLQQDKIRGKVLDFGCGIGKDVELLFAKGFDITGYDPAYFPEYPKEKFDTILCFYVLNVLLPEEQTQVLMNISNLLKPDGKAFFAVRRDIRFKGFRMHKLHQKETYQCQVKLPFQSIFENKNCEIYEYQHYTTLNAGNLDKSPFFMKDQKLELIVETASVFAFYPVSSKERHALVVPKRRVSSYAELTLKEQMACQMAINKVKAIFKEKYDSEIDIRFDTHQEIGHFHIHVIPTSFNHIQ